MVSFYLEQDNAIVIADNDLQRLTKTLEFMPQYAELEIQESDINIDYYNGQYYFVNDPVYIEAKAQEEARRIAQLHLTRGDVFRGLLLARGVTRQVLRGMIEAMPEETTEQRLAKEMALIDFDEALDFYRGVTLIDTLGTALGITSNQMTKFFETNDYHELMPNVGGND